MSPLIHYYGTPITPRTVLHTLSGRSFCVPYPEPRDVDICHEIGESVMLDNGAFTIWGKVRDGKPLPAILRACAAGDWSGYYEWVTPWLDFHTTWAIIPDVILGDAEANDALIAEWPHGRKGAPVWHMHEPIERLLRLATEWDKVCIGSSGGYANVGDPTWTRRIEDALDALCGDGPPPVWLHMLRGLHLAGSRFPFASADSTNVARNHAGSHKAPKKLAANMAAENAARQCPARWRMSVPAAPSLMEAVV